ncbi:MAG: Ig-like domain-containing protein [Pseudorhodoplanes sp.]|nr:Ig-like domain-containing protein [Pseudorhodoplanes sp.]
MSSNYHPLSAGALVQNWSNNALLTANDDWSGVPSIQGFRGDDLVTVTDADPRTITGDSTVLDVNANQTNPASFFTGGVAEFELTDSTIALAGSGTADAPYLVFYLDATGRQDINVQFDVRDLESADNATQQINVQYRIGNSGAWTNVPGGYLADATDASSPLVTHIDVTLPDDADNQGQVQVRVMTVNAGGNDEWVGIDNINIASLELGGSETPPPALVSSNPADDATGTDASADIVLTFSETVQAGTGFITITDGAGDVRMIAVNDPQVTISGNVVTIDPTADLAAATAYDVIVDAGAFEDASGNDFAGIAQNELDFTTASALPPITHTISEIQGNGHISAFAGTIQTLQGVVTALDTNGSRGFYIQDPAGDGNAATSDAIFVFMPSGALPQVGRLVQVTGTISEFVPSGAAPGSFSTTEITVSEFADLGEGPAIAPVQIGGIGGLIPPTESNIAAGKFFESLEGMLVVVKEAVATGPTTSFGEIFTVVDNDDEPSNGTSATGQTDRGNLLIEPGAPDFGDTNTSGGDFNPERVQIDDDNGVLAGFSSPGVNVGARLGDVVGIVNYDFGNYQVVATQAFTVDEPSTLTKETTALQGDADRLTVASYNAENLDANDPQSRFDTIAAEIVDRLKAPDIIALQEIQDNDGTVGGEGSAAVAANETLQQLIDAIVAAGGPVYEFIDNTFIGDDTNGGQPGGNIRTAFLYRADRVDVQAGSVGTIAPDGTLLSSSYIDQQTNPDNPFYDSRPPLVATFTFNGKDVTIVNNHFSSKGGSAPLLGSDQPPFNAGEVQRAAQAQVVNNFVDAMLASDPDAKVIVAGDLNEFPWEEPMQVVKGTATVTDYDVPGEDPIAAVAEFVSGGTAVLSDLLDLLPEDERYDYVFDGNSQTLDHVLATAALMPGVNFDVVRINSEFADQTSDHDPLVASFLIPASPIEGTPDDDLRVGTDGGDYIFVFAGNDTVRGERGNDYIEGGQDDDRLQGGNDDDQLFGGEGNDFLQGQQGNDRLYGGEGDDRLSGVDGNDTLGGDNGNDVLEGKAGDDRLLGGNGKDRLDGGVGNDSMTGDGGADLFVFASGTDAITDFSGVTGGELDRIDLRQIAGLGSFADVAARMSDVGGNVEIDFADLLGAGHKLVIENLTVAQLGANDFLV